MRSLVTGATGFIGQHLVSKLEQPVVLGRDLNRLQKMFGDAEAHEWDQTASLDPLVLRDVDTVFHLAGESVYKGRWNTAKKERIVRSRIDSTRHLVQAMAKMEKPPSTFICASAIGIYGDRGGTFLTESSSPGDDFLAKVCVDWEKEAAKAEEIGVRVIQLRIGLVLGKDGGALPQMLTPFKLGVGGKISSGSQYMSWIHIDDLIGIMLHAANNASVLGPINGVAPEPVTNKEFTSTLASILFRPALFSVPGCVLKITLGEFGEVLLVSQRVIPEKMSQAGYSFLFTQLHPALHNLLKE